MLCIVENCLDTAARVPVALGKEMWEYGSNKAIETVRFEIGEINGVKLLAAEGWRQVQDVGEVVMMVHIQACPETASVILRRNERGSVCQTMVKRLGSS